MSRHDPQRQVAGGDVLTVEDYRGMTTLRWAHVAMRGEFKLNMYDRLTCGRVEYTGAVIDSIRRSPIH